VLSQQLATRFKEYVNNPIVTVSLEEVRPVPVSVLGEVPKPGIYQLEPTCGVLQAVAAAGGFTPFANKDVFVLRNAQRIRFDFDKVQQCEGRGSQFRLKAGDVLIVE
jgi:polysaccharide export outer membrane protein